MAGALRVGSREAENVENSGQIQDWNKTHVKKPWCVGRSETLRGICSLPFAHFQPRPRTLQARTFHLSPALLYPSFYTQLSRLFRIHIPSSQGSSYRYAWQLATAAHSHTN